MISWPLSPKPFPAIALAAPSLRRASPPFHGDVKAKCRAAAEEGVQVGPKMGLVVVWKPMPYFRKVRSILDRFAAANAAAVPS